MKKIIFDFDNTLFDTQTWKAKMFFLLSKAGVIYDEARPIYDGLILEQHGNFSLVNYLNRLTEHNLLSETQRNAFEVDYAQMDFTEYLFADTRRTLGALGVQCELWLLTKGIPDMQEEKIERSGLGKYFKDRIRIVPKDKVSALIAIGMSDGDMFVNDHLEETTIVANEIPQLKCFLRKRSDRTYEPTPPPKITYIENISEIGQII